MENRIARTLSQVVAALEHAGVAYAVTGSVASSAHGEPIVSQDIDIVLHGGIREAMMIARQLSSDFYVHEETMSEAARNQSMCNIIDHRTGLKVDLSFVPPSGFKANVIARRQKFEIGPDHVDVYFVTAEDVILMKLLWRKDSRSQKQWENALGVARVQGARMDWKYLFEQARTLGIEDDLIRLRDEAGI